MATEHNVQTHVDTWTGFTRLMAVCMVAVVIVLILMAVFLV